MKRIHHKTPTLEEITHKMNGATTVFSRLDAKNGHWCIELDKESSNMCTVNSPAEKYRYLRLPFGFCASQDIFQKCMDDVTSIAGEGVIGIADDLVVYGKTIKEHDEALCRVLSAVIEHGLVLRLVKCVVRSEAIKFYGIEWSKDGMKPNVKKCDDLRDRLPPVNNHELYNHNLILI